jgi:hypothetical protein
MNHQERILRLRSINIGSANFSANWLVKWVVSYPMFESILN